MYNVQYNYAYYVHQIYAYDILAYTYYCGLHSIAQTHLRITVHCTLYYSLNSLPFFFIHDHLRKMYLVFSESIFQTTSTYFLHNHIQMSHSVLSQNCIFMYWGICHARSFSFKCTSVKLALLLRFCWQERVSPSHHLSP